MLKSVNSPEDLKALSERELDILGSEIRGFLIDNVSKTGGHLASNLGAVELTLALHRIFDTEKDRLVFDVGHQSYVHKILTGRKYEFKTLRKLGGLSGFPKPNESIHDAAVAGHASTSVSVALGMARARTLAHEDYSVVAVIGDGALTGGTAYEGLCNAGQSKEPLTVILNDNGMSIDNNVGGISEMLAGLRVKPAYFRFKRRYRQIFGHMPALYNFNHAVKEWFKRRLLPGNIFDDLGFHYLGPVDGHDISQLEAVIGWAKELKTPVLVHVITQKGRGYTYAEQEPENYHGVDAFDVESGVEKCPHNCFSEAFGTKLTELAKKDEKIVAITAAMCGGTGLSDFSKEFPERFFDVGIAEEHAVAMAAGLASRGAIPVFAVYSSFLQRGYDMMIHDVSLSKLHVIFAVDRAGIVGHDGETHQGVFDVAYLCSVPHMAVFAPASYKELRDMLELAIYRIDGPVAVRYPRGGEGEYTQSAGKAPSTVLREGKDVTLVSYGIMINNVLEAAKMLESAGIEAEVIKLNLINPLDTATVLRSLRKTGRLLTAEDVCAFGSVGSRLLATVAEEGLALTNAKSLDLGNGIVQHGSVDELEKLAGLDAQSIAETAKGFFADIDDRSAGENAI
ncbi:MAG: 1-deoxy-D-xylulose-5-phosphate synthase [Firmicutes bacterium HGW-Firmicutes-16]|nr:MAG: 1-deoxy-D-xylulose-5-phosphate synthase [Firmicutes bacterium HGW-Firmicutes-16]